MSPPTPTDDPERQPLLPPLAEINGIVTSTISDEDRPTNDDANKPDTEEKAYPWTILWYVVWAAAGTLSLVLFIKAFIDAGDVDFDFKKALKSALGGGLSGAAAMVLQVLTLMPLRTVMNYQYRYGTSTTEAIGTLYADGGYVRYYQGLSAALVQGPVARFGDTAANVGILALLESNTFMRTLPKFIQTVFASTAAALFRMILTPVDTLKTTLQTQGKRGWSILKTRIKVYGLGTLWYGAWATAAATFVGHYPWFGTYNQLDKSLPPATTIGEQISRQAFIGFVASIVSDTVSNSLRVVKTYRQVNETRIGYLDAARAVVATDGIRGLLGRGLKTRIIANGAQGLMFSVLWKLFMNIWENKTRK
ncbi:mitochondrial carrier domain-containing protein [Russula earlei]|uniref:Mitochondrial carrier domain-containing protein n=1 Tax=Russula earlei TaxID=71964 RepID=A0ACC0U011_9AGAM|nr:mitochondrial carrier domain-containing protein [Russula earlei]